MKYWIYYKQSGEERYESDVNERVESAIESIGAEILGDGGGCGFNSDDPLPAEQDYCVEATSAQLEAIRAFILAWIGAPDTLEIDTLAAKEAEWARLEAESKYIPTHIEGSLS